MGSSLGFWVGDSRRSLKAGGIRTFRRRNLRARIIASSQRRRTLSGLHRETAFVFHSADNGYQEFQLSKRRRFNRMMWKEVDIAVETIAKDIISRFTFLGYTALSDAE